MNFPQHGRHIETMCVVIDFENLSIQRHYYWPGIEALRDVSGLFRIHIFNSWKIDTVSLCDIRY